MPRLKATLCRQLLPLFTACLALNLAGCNAANQADGRRHLPPRHPVVKELPASFTGRVPNSDNGYATFEMILVPGDDSRDLPPFYIGQTEVTWGMLLYWAYGGDLDDLDKLYQLKQQGLRPSPIGHGHPQYNYGLVNNDATRRPD